MSKRTIQFFFVTSVLSGSLGSYDEYLTCDRLYQTRRTARVLDHVPCDMNKQTYCEHKGSAYPEHAIWRFKEENKALMRRLYGDVDSTEVYREMRSHQLFSEELPEKERADRSSSYTVNMVPFDENMFNGLHYNIRVGSGLAMVKNAKDESVKMRLPSLRPRTRTRARTTRQTTTTSSSTVVTVQTTTSSSSESRLSTQQFTTATTEMPTTAPPTTIRQPQQQPTIQPTTAEMQETTLTTEQQTYFTNSEQDTYSTLGRQDSIIEQGDDVDEAEDDPTKHEHKDISEEKHDVVQTTEQGGTPEPPIHHYQEVTEDYDVQYGEESDYDSLDDEEEKDVEPLPEQLPHLSAPVEDDLQDEDILEEIVEEIAEEVEEKLDAEIDEAEAEEELEEEEQELIEYTGESINACPVYEEVKAPFWANNTRNQVLALLNLYPFEQYIHMERCKDEGEEMLCRPGCRCEQQYRLHRLLAFDPNNECRGIFSDWFRFPSFCLCKCYNVPEQILASINRLPRKLEKSGKPQTSHKKKKKMETTKAKSRHAGPGPTHNSNQRLENHRMSKDSRGFHTLELGPFDARMKFNPEASIPAIFPYEGKAAIMAELDRIADQADREQQDQPTSPPTLEEMEEVEEHLIDLESIADEHIDNTVESDQVHFKKSSKEARNLDDHFFYNNPIVEFKLPDGTTGSVYTRPRK